MKTKTRNTKAANAVWAFVSTDAHESDAKWAGCVSLFRRKADALRCMKTQIHDDRECGLFTRRELIWSDDRMACIDNNGRMSYKVEKLEIREGSAK